MTSSPSPPSSSPGNSRILLCAFFFRSSMRVEQREMRDSMPPLVAIRERGNTFSITSIHSSRASSSSELLPFFISYVRLSPGWGGGQAENSVSSRDPHVALLHRGGCSRPEGGVVSLCTGYQTAHFLEPHSLPCRRGGGGPDDIILVNDWHEACHADMQ